MTLGIQQPLRDTHHTATFAGPSSVTTISLPKQQALKVTSQQCCVLNREQVAHMHHTHTHTLTHSHTHTHTHTHTHAHGMHIHSVRVGAAHV